MSNSIMKRKADALRRSGGKDITSNNIRGRKGNNTVEGWYYPNHMDNDHGVNSAVNNGRKGNNNVESWYWNWGSHQTPPNHGVNQFTPYEMKLIYEGQVNSVYDCVACGDAMSGGGNNSGGTVNNCVKCVHHMSTM